MARPSRHRTVIDDNRVGFRDRYGTVGISALIALAVSPLVIFYAQNASSTVQPKPHNECEEPGISVGSNRLVAMEYMGNLELDRICVTKEPDGSQRLHFESE